MAVNPGPNCHLTKARMEAIRNGSPLIRMLVEWGMGSNTNSGPSFFLVIPADSAGLRTAESPGRLPLVSRTGPIPESSTWTPMAISLSAEEGARFGAYVRATHRTGTRHPL